jgi:hypothetical protein
VTGGVTVIAPDLAAVRSALNLGADRP